MGYKPQTRYPAFPLLCYMSRRPFDAFDQPPPTMGEMSEALGISDRSLYRWAVEGIPEAAADRAACAVGKHPSELWPNWFANCPQATP